MNIDLSCPVELWQFALPTDETPECSFQLNAMSEKAIVSIQVTLCCFDKAGQPLAQQTERIQWLHTDDNGRIIISLTPNQWSEEIKNINLIIEKVWFEDQTVWRRGEYPLSQYRPNALSTGKELDQLRFVAGQDSVGYPEIQDEVWLCVCGRPNHPEAESCCRCHRRKAVVMEKYSRENVSKLEALREEALNARAKEALEKNNRFQETREKQEIARARRRKARIRKTLILVFAVLAVAAFVVFGIPAMKYFSAQKKLGEAKIDEARSIFSSLGDYRDSHSMLTECDYQEAMLKSNSGEAESMEQAQLLFEQLGDYQDSADLAKKTAYQLGEAYLKSHLYESAAEKFSGLDQYEDSPKRYLEAIYLQGCDLMDKESYDTARLLFAAIPDYQDAEEKEMECSYLLARQLVETGNWEAALGELEDLNGYQNADELIKQARYGLAEERMATEDYEAAADLYAAAGDYQDASFKANECIYMLGVHNKDEAAYAEALSLFARIPDFQDAKDQIDACLYALGKEAADHGDYELAVSYYGDAPDPDTLSDQSREFLGDCHYQLAQAALRGGDREAAEAELENAAVYGKAQKELNKLRFSLAEADFEAGDYEKALTRYLALEDYKGSTTKAKACRYAMAEKALNEGNYDAAIELYSLLKNYKESETQLKETKYQKALTLRNAGDEDGAMQLLIEIGGKKAKTVLNELYKEKGDTALEAGDYDSAVEHYSQIDGTEGKKLAKSVRYHQAWEAQEAGDYLTAAQLYQQIGAYEDAPVRLEECKIAYWGNAEETAKSKMEQKDYAGVVEALDGLDMQALSVFYPKLPEIYQEASYLQAEALYNSGKPYEAISYYQRAGDYRHSNTEKLKRKPYLILGDWDSGDGSQISFFTNGTCNLNGEKRYFKVSGYNLYTGTDADSLGLTHRISELDENELILQEIQGENEITISLSRKGTWFLEPLVLPEKVFTESSKEEELAQIVSEEATEQPAQEELHDNENPES